MFPILLSFASFQDWDGFYQYDYTIQNKGESIDHYFRMDLHPGKMSMVPISSLFFRKFYLKSSKNLIINNIPIEKLDIELYNRFPDFYWLPGFNFNFLFNSKLETRFIEKGDYTREFSSNNINDTNQWPFKTEEIEWSGDNKTNIFIVNTPNFKMATGFFSNNFYEIGNFQFNLNLNYLNLN